MTIEQAIQEDNIRKMQDEVIYEFGFENLKTIWFFKWCERYSYEVIEEKFYKLMKGRVEA